MSLCDINRDNDSNPIPDLHAPYTGATVPTSDIPSCQHPSSVLSSCLRQCDLCDCCTVYNNTAIPSPAFISTPVYPPSAVHSISTCTKEPVTLVQHCALHRKLLVTLLISHSVLVPTA